MAQCARCKLNTYVDPATGLCFDCAQLPQAQTAAPPRAAGPDDLAAIILTTETAPGMAIGRRLGIVSAEVVIGVNLFEDIASSFRDVFGGRSKALQDNLRKAKDQALQELRQEAHALGANAVVATALNYSEVSGGGKSMLFLVATGTAVTVTDAAADIPTHVQERA